jgi:hypothetical protein
VRVRETGGKGERESKSERAERSGQLRLFE